MRLNETRKLNKEIAQETIAFHTASSSSRSFVCDIPSNDSAEEVTEDTEDTEIPSRPKKNFSMKLRVYAKNTSIWKLYHLSKLNVWRSDYLEC